MKKFLAVLLVMCMAVMPVALVYAGGTITADSQWVSGQNMKIVHVRVDTVGADGTTTPIALPEFNGALWSALFVPDGTVTDNWDVQLYSIANGFVYSGTNFTDRHTTEPMYHEYTSNMVPIYEPIGFSVYGLGQPEAVDVYFYIQVPK